MLIRSNKIFIKIFITMFISIMFFTTIYSIYTLSKQKSQILKALDTQAFNMSKMLIYISSDAIILNDGSIIVEVFDKFLNQNSMVEELIFSRNSGDSYVVRDSNWSYEDKLDEIYNNKNSNEPSYKIVYSQNLKTDVFLYTYPIFLSNTKWGELHMSLSLEEYNSNLKNMYFEFIAFFFFSILTIIVVSYLIAKKLSMPVIKLNRVAKRIKKGNLELRSDYKSNDELGELSTSFNEMISTIEISQKALQRSREDLELKVKNRTLELYETNKELEDKTKALEELNKSLDSRIKEELKKREKQEELMIQQSRLAAMGEMIANISHQWRQPLSAITTSASGIRLEKEFGMSDDERELDKLDTIVKTSNYLSKTIDDFSNFFRPNKTKQEFDIEIELDRALTLVGASLKFNYIEVEKMFKKCGKVYGLPNEFSQAVMNILTNAKDILVERKIDDPLVVIRIYEENNCGVLEIEDNGGGIEEEVLPRIFEPYYTTKHQSQGTGIGLYMSKVIVEQNMQGKLTVKNTNDGVTFTIKIPMV